MAQLAFDVIARDRASAVFDKIGAKADKTNANFSKVGSGMTGMLGKIGGAVGGLAVGWQAWDKIVAGGFTRLMNLDDARKRLDQMGLSTSEAADLMAGLKETVTGTAFALDEGANVMTRFVTAGVDLDEVNARLEMTADTAAFAQAPLSEIGDIFGDIQTQGKLTGQELRMLQERGVPALQLLADAAGVSAEAMQAMISEGAVDAEKFFDLWEQGSKGFGENNIKIEGAAQSMGDTIRGSLANAGTALSKMGEALLEDFTPAIKGVADGFRTAGDAVVAFMDETEPFRDFFGDTIGQLIEWDKQILQFVGIMEEDASGAAKTFQSAMDGAKSGAQGVAAALGEQASQAQIANETLGAYLETIARSTDPVLALSGALEDVDAAQAAYNEAVAEFGEKSPEAESAAFKLAGAVSKAEQAAINGDLSFEDFERKLADWVAQGAITAGQAETIRGRVKDLRGEAENFAGTYKATLDLKTQGLQTWQNAKAWLDSIKSKTVTITAHAQLPPGVTTRQIMEGRQHGGPVKAGDPYIVGERGPELFVPDRPGLVFSNKDTKTMTGQGGSVSPGRVVIGNAAEVGEGVVRAMRQAGLVMPRVDAARQANLITRGG